MTRIPSLLVPLMLLAAALLGPSAAMGNDCIPDCQVRVTLWLQKCNQNSCGPMMQGLGNGVVFYADDSYALILTAGHNLNPMRGEKIIKAEVDINGAMTPAETLHYDQSADLRVVKVNGNYAGHQTVIISHEDDVNGPITMRCYWPKPGTDYWQQQSRTARAVKTTTVRHYFSPAVSEKGCSGAGYYNPDGLLVGIHIGIVQPENQMIAVRAEYIRRKLIEWGFTENHVKHTCARPLITTPTAKPIPPASDGDGPNQCCCDCEQYRCECGPKWAKQGQINLTQSQRIAALEARIESLRADLRSIELTPGPSGPPGKDGKDAIDTDIPQRVAEIEKYIKKPFDVQLFVNGQPTTKVRQVQPHGGWLPIDLPLETVKQEK